MIEILTLANNTFTGTIPLSLQDLSALSKATLFISIFFWLYFVTYLTFVFLITYFYIGFLNLEGNALEGNIPSGLSNSLDLEQINLDGNLLSGTIPTELGLLINLEILQLHGNNFEGEIPTEICSLPSLRELTADCSEVTCDCCTTCF